MIPIARPLLGEEEKKAVLEVLESGRLAQGQKVREFEGAFARYLGVKHAVATINGTAALHVALMAHQIGPGDEVITSPFTFIATANTIRMAGARPVFVDVDERTFNIDVHLIEAAITSKTKVILPIHLYGKAAEMDQIHLIAKEHNLIVIEDACQAHGAEFKGQKAGSFGTACFSFYPTKNMTTGEGGMITTNESFIAEKVREIINHGSLEKYYHNSLGYNYRMTEIAAAIGIEQLKKLEEFNARRKRNALYLNQGLATLKGLIMPAVEDGHVFHQYTIRVSPLFGLTRDEVADQLLKKGISSSVFYPLPVHKQKAYADCNSQEFPVAEKLAREVLSIPVHPSLTDQELDQIIKAFGELK